MRWPKFTFGFGLANSMRVGKCRTSLTIWISTRYAQSASPRFGFVRRFSIAARTPVALQPPNRRAPIERLPYTGAAALAALQARSKRGFFRSFFSREEGERLAQHDRNG